MLVKNTYNPFINYIVIHFSLWYNRIYDLKFLVKKMNSDIKVIESKEDLLELIKNNIKSMKKDLLLNYPHNNIERFEQIKKIQLQELTLEFLENINKAV